MLDLFRLVLLGVAVHACMRARFFTGLAIALATFAAVVTDVVVLACFPPTTVSLEAPLAALIMGPSAIPRGESMPLASVANEPLRNGPFALLSVVAARAASRRADQSHPETEASRRWDRIGLVFVALAVSHALLAVSGLLGRWIEWSR